MSALLEISDLHAGYGSAEVLFGIDLALAQGNVAALLGRNGMGKTTTIKCLTGLLPVRGGSIRFAGKEIAGLTPEAIARQGLAVVPEGRQIFPNLSVRENLTAFAGNRAGSQDPWTFDKVIAFLPRLGQRLSNMGNQLSGGEQQMLAIGRALMTNPHLLILDEATEGLAPLIREEIWRCLATLKSAGQSILVIDKYVEKLLPLADGHTILERGRVAWTGSSALLSQDREVWTRYLGV
ncbi:ABC transporter ATP-binding protein [Lacibacterium aquatile]|uniref:ABC transporter ATP-binding protein n=1 Tax=Lacibacterium aquatile TaxID=1168082 RepID=A0ABW5DWP9_9PROT